MKITPFKHSLCTTVDIVTTKRDKPVLVFVNPAGGAGKAYRLVMEYVVAVWSEAEFQHHIMITGLSNTLAQQTQH
jgi:hypothetical protein